MNSQDLVNREFGDYHILRLIGVGSMAEVYLAEQRSLGRRVALKILKPELAKDETYIKRFIREARAIAKLSHPNLVQIYQADSIDGYWFIAQEYIQGQTLQQLIKKKGVIPAKLVADLLWQVSAALDKAAQAGVVHRDVKPDNILIGDDGQVKVADFGLARVSDSSDESKLALTQVGMTLGTPLYMSPEQAQGKALDHRSDMYSLGISCYHALAGEPPFRGDTALAVAIQHVNKDPEQLELRRPDIPPPLARVVHRMIAKKPEDRYQTFSDIQQDLRLLYSLFFNETEASSHLTDWNQFRIGQTDAKLLATTEKLQQAMRREKSRGFFKPMLFWAGIFLGILLLGGGMGFWRVYSMPSPLTEPKSTIIPRKETVAEQWVYACLLDSPDAWHSVIDYFPNEDYWGRKAKRQLIRYYFHNGDTYHSLPIFQEFSELSDVDAEDQALGLAGLAWCYSENQNDITLALDSIRQLFELPISYSDPLLVQILDAANKMIQQKKDHPPANGKPHRPPDELEPVSKTSV